MKLGLSDFHQKQALSVLRPVRTIKIITFQKICFYPQFQPFHGCSFLLYETSSWFHLLFTPPGVCTTVSRPPACNTSLLSFTFHCHLSTNWSRLLLLPLLGFILQNLRLDSKGFTLPCILILQPHLQHLQMEIHVGQIFVATYTNKGSEYIFPIISCSSLNKYNDKSHFHYKIMGLCRCCVSFIV